MQCAICRKSIDEPGEGQPAAWFPFCSERCKLVDLGRWLDGRYQIAVSPDEEDGGSAAEDGEARTEDAE